VNCDSRTIGPAVLVAFCQHVIAKRLPEWPPTEEILAQEFVEYFKFKSLIVLEEIQKLCDNSEIILRITPLPDPLWGYNRRYQGKREILISNSQVLTKEHTALHELRELLEYEFHDLGTPICTNNEDQEERAETFAISVRMCAFAKEVPGIMDSVGSIESKWRRSAACGLFIVFAAVYCIGLALSPKVEEVMQTRRTQQPTLTR
jgi:hypothetical protein